MWAIFPGEPYQARQVDSAFTDEATAAASAGFSCASLDFEALLSEANATRAVRSIPAQDALTTAIYRGWMLTPDQYHSLYEALLLKNLRLVNMPEAYRHGHYLPENYPVIASYTPETVSVAVGPDFQIDGIFPLLLPFGNHPLILKDYVKSQKHYWTEACFIPDASDHEAVRRVVTRFLELQGDSLAHGLVFREFVELKPLTAHPKSGMPLTREFRLFFLDSKRLAEGRYWDEADYGDDDLLPPASLFEDVAERVQSRFFTMDVAQRTNGEWLIIELGDAQVSGLPESLDRAAFYEALWNRLTFLS